MIKWVVFFISILFCCPIFSRDETSIGIGVITNKFTRASETFKIYEILNGLEFRDRSRKKVDIVYSDNASSANFYLTGELEHYIFPVNKYVAPKNIMVIDGNNKKREYYGDGYVTKLKLQIWKDQQFHYLFSDSVIYFPSEDERATPQYSVVSTKELYDESFELISPLLLNFFKYLEREFGIQVSGLKNGKILKYDLKPHILGNPIDLDKFLSTTRSDIVKSSYRSGSFNEYFENRFTTIASKELFFVDKYGNQQMRNIISTVSYPKTCWKEAVASYLDLADKFMEEKNYEGFSIASWAALILSNQLKEKITDIFKLKKRALENLSVYSKLANHVEFNGLLQLNISLIDGLLTSGITKESEQKYDQLMSELRTTFSASQDAMDDLRKQERLNKIMSGLAYTITLGSAVNDGLKGGGYVSSTTSTLMSGTMDLEASLSDRLYSSMNHFQTHFSNINFDIPVSFIQPEVDDKIDFNKAILYLECMKLVFADKDNRYWQSCFVEFTSTNGSQEITNAFLQVKTATSENRSALLVSLSKALSKFERNAFLTEKLKRYAKRAF